MATFPPIDPTQPPDSAAISQGASNMRSIWSFLNNFLGVSFNMTTGQILSSAISNGLPTPYGAAGTVLTSAGPGTAPTWNVPGAFAPGFMMPYAGSIAGGVPAGWLACDGTTKNIASYPGLAAVIGTTYGGDGVTTFGLPDCRGRTLVGVGTGTAPGASAWALATTNGEETHTLVTAEMPAHQHSLPWAQYSGQHQNGAQPAGVYPVVTGVGNTNDSSVGGGGAHNNLQPSLGMNWLVKT